jgi:UDPglucose--hexose-1-phosphate uridylyltransferase
MSKYVPDILSRRWVIISTQRSKRPGVDGKRHRCPLCEGNEKDTPPEVLRYGKGQPDKPGWKVRVIPNKFPITDFHEVIIHSPDHIHDIETLPLDQVELIFHAYRDRYNFYRKKGQVIIFCNHGTRAGASLDHPHAQLVVIPSQINLDALTKEPLNNMVDENKFFNVYCPDFSQWPYEVWITPKVDEKVFGDIKDEEIKDLIQILKSILKRMKTIQSQHPLTNLPFGYNFYIYPKESWYLRVIPRFIDRAGFELGTGLSVNVMEPTDAMYELKGMEERVGHVLTKLRSKMK